jgi:hypothetical protein
MSSEELKHALETARPFFDACRQRWAELMITTLPGEGARRESYYAMICGLNAVEREWRAAANPRVEVAPVQAGEAGWNGLPVEDGE